MTTTTPDMWTSDKVRTTFIEYFVTKHNHVHHPSSPVFLSNDPTLLFTNSGMCQFKDIFLQTSSCQELPSNRLITHQKCVRIGGKHNDLDEVGTDGTHHTFFEMLGNWSFEDYWQEDIIPWVWELLTKVYKLDEKRLYVTYFGGDEKLGLKPDNKVKEIWSKFLPENKIVPFGSKDNFWEMGEIGPCGTSTEIFYDMVPNRENVGNLIDIDKQIVEIWNVVFMKYLRVIDRSVKLLPSRYIDTGMGLERLTCCLQNKMCNYDTDVFEETISTINEITPCCYTGKYGEEDENEKDKSYRILCDHIRTIVFILTDGIVPGPKGRSYVLRLLIRRCINVGRRLTSEGPFLDKLVHCVVQKLGHVYPEVVKREKHVLEEIKKEQLLFLEVVQKSIKEFRKRTKKLNHGDSIPQKTVQLLRESHGMPKDVIDTLCNQFGFVL